MQDLKEFENYEQGFHVLNPMMQSMVLVVREIKNDRIDISSMSKFLFFESHNKNSSFSKLPPEALVNIASYTGMSNSLDVKDADDTAYESFGI